MRSAPDLRRRRGETLSGRSTSRSVAVGAALALVPLLALPAAANEDDPAGLRSGVEGSKAALVRIEISATTEIVHVDHTTGDVELERGKYAVPVNVATGVVTSADGIIATAGDSLTVDETAVGVHAANLLFTNRIGVQVRGNGGDLSRRGFTTDRYWADHLQHCYDREEHCILFLVPKYTVFTYTKPRSTANAELINDPESPDDVALLQVGGGGGMPTARLAAKDAGAKQTDLIGFTERPAPGAEPSSIDVEVDSGARHVGSETPLAPRLSQGLSGSPVVDADTGEVLGLVYPHAPEHGGHGGGDPGAQFIPQSAVRSAMEDTGTRPTPSQFDAVFRRGVDQLAGGGSPESATGSFEESRTYYPSALAAQHLDTANGDDGSGNTSPAAAPETGEQGAGWLPGGGWAALAVLLLLVAGAAALALRRGRRAPRQRQQRQPTEDASPRRTPAMAGAAEPRQAGVPAPAEDVRRPPPQTRGNTETARRGRPRSAKYCTSCGESLSEKANFCGSCGEPIG
jgi:hypothetical protein